MISETFSIDGFNARHKDGYYLINQDRVSEKGNQYTAEDKTFPTRESAQNYLKSKGVDNNDAAFILNKARGDYEQKESASFIAAREKAKQKALTKQLTGE